MESQFGCKESPGGEGRRRSRTRWPVVGRILMQLVINTFGASLRRQGDYFVVRSGPKRMVAAAAKVRSMLATTTFCLLLEATP